MNYVTLRGNNAAAIASGQASNYIVSFLLLGRRDLYRHQQAVKGEVKFRGRWREFSTKRRAWSASGNDRG
ncbi:hypothetical protein DBV15_09204 [Temnothorax longispinosus]|uniref:Uncharacterized protein n=1 Tax=Temnothorax longispinosus TaxID=300112 RepID=A0A4S2KER2_9HYME|nr:hypothetical protein DBV15_09204 [Temnothorax longispinosus]